jgi:hypothetical protein
MVPLTLSRVHSEFSYLFTGGSIGIDFLNVLASERVAIGYLMSRERSEQRMSQYLIGHLGDDK